LGNLVQRVVTLIDAKLGGSVVYEAAWNKDIPALAEVFDDTEYHRAFEQFRLHDAAAAVWAKIGLANAYFNAQEPWKQEGETQKTTLGAAATMVGHIAKLLQPFMPATATKIGELLAAPLEAWQDGQVVRVTKGDALFPRRA
jgi:methionyl-tRNA synthetase